MGLLKLSFLSCGVTALFSFATCSRISGRREVNTMQNAHERAIEIATALMIEHLKINGYGKRIDQADEMAEFFLRLEASIASGLAKLPD